MNNKGLTIVELITSISLVLVAMVFLFNIIFLLRETYNDNRLGSETTVRNALFLHSVNQDFIVDNIVSIGSCPLSGANNCFAFDLANGDEKLLRIFAPTVVGESHRVIYGDETLRLDGDETIDVTGIRACVRTTMPIPLPRDHGSAFNSYFILTIPITSGAINLVYPFDRDRVYITEISPC